MFSTIYIIYLSCYPSNFDRFVLEDQLRIHYERNQINHLSYILGTSGSFHVYFHVYVDSLYRLGGGLGPPTTLIHVYPGVGCQEVVPK